MSRGSSWLRMTVRRVHAPTFDEFCPAPDLPNSKLGRA
jgi:hypothetical protein